MGTKMKNVYDIRYEKNLTYLLPCKTVSSAGKIAEERMDASFQAINGIGIADDTCDMQGETYAKTAVILYLYYSETLSTYWKYIDEIPRKIHIYIISSQRAVLEETQRHMDLLGRHNVDYILKENRGRDISALLITGAEIIKNYEYICFLHDKKEHSEKVKQDTDLWIENLWGNLLGSSGYIHNILNLLEKTETLGVLVPPEPIGDHFCTWYGYGWHHSFDITKKLADKLGLKTNLTADKPPITIGTALWFRTEALKKLFESGWHFDNFDDTKLSDRNYISYGIERIFAYVAQDAGYDTGTVMTVAYAQKQTGYLQHSISRLFMEAKVFFPIASIYDLERYEENVQDMLSFARKNRRLYLYGTGDMGKFCFFVLRKENLLPEAYVTSEKTSDDRVNGLPVYTINEIKDDTDAAIIISVFGERDRKEIVANLTEKGFYNFMEFWK